MTKRIIFGLLAFVILFAVTYFNNLVFLIGCFCVAAVMIWELYRALGLKTNVFVLLIVFIPLFELGVFDFLDFGIWAAFIVLLLYYLFSDCSFNDVSKTFMVIMYIAVPIICLHYIREIDYGSYFIWFALMGSFASDTFAIFIGKCFGKLKLFEKVSPKKTIAGAIGGIIGVIICFVVFAYFIGWKTGNAINYFGFDGVISLAIVCGVFSQLGDLVASRIKREHNIKDYGDLIPGHGGMLDRCDSVLLIAPMVYLWVTQFSLFI